MGGPGSGRKKGSGNSKAKSEYGRLRGVMSDGGKNKVSRTTAREMAKVAKRRGQGK